MDKRKEVEQFISDLEVEIQACEENGFTFSASNMRDEVERLQKLLHKGIIPRAIK